MKYWRAFRLKLSDLRAFPADFYSGFLSMPIQIAITYGFWRTTLGAGEVNGFTAANLGMYFISVQVLQMAMRPGVIVTWELWRDINRGDLTTWLTRPILYPLYVFAQKVSEFQIRMASGILLLEVSAVLLLHRSPVQRILIGSASSLLGFMILFGLHFTIGTLTVYLGNVLTLRDNIINFTTLLGGGILPVTILPAFVQATARYTPLPSIYYAPARILSDPSLAWISVTELIKTQFVWIGVFLVVVLVLWEVSIRKYDPQGG